jgi:hypothetical protein
MYALKMYPDHMSAFACFLPRRLKTLEDAKKEFMSLRWATKFVLGTFQEFAGVWGGNTR